MNVLPSFYEKWASSGNIIWLLVAFVTCLHIILTVHWIRNENDKMEKIQNIMVHACIHGIEYLAWTRILWHDSVMIFHESEYCGLIHVWFCINGNAVWAFIKANAKLKSNFSQYNGIFDSNNILWGCIKSIHNESRKLSILYFVKNDKQLYSIWYSIPS